MIAAEKPLKHVVMTSGGVGSFVTLCMVVEEFGAENVVSLFADTLIEDEDLYRFLTHTHTHTGVPLTRIADGRTPAEVFRDKKYFGNTRVDLCSRILKRELMDKWVAEHYKPDECICYIGIDWGEKHRFERLGPWKLPYIYKAPLVDAMMMLTTEQKISYCQKLGIDPPNCYAMGFPHSNCGGWCVKAGLAQFKLLYEKIPERYLKHERIQEELMAEQPKLKPFLRHAKNGKTTYLTMKQYREQFLMPGAGQQLTLDDEIDWGGCGCAIDYPEDVPA